MSDPDPSKQSRAMSLIIINRQPFISQKRKPNNATCYQQHRHHFHDQDHHDLHRGSSSSSLTWICSSVAAFSSLHVAQMMMIMVVTMVMMMMVMMMVMMVMMMTMMRMMMVMMMIMKMVMIMLPAALLHTILCSHQQ